MKIKPTIFLLPLQPYYGRVFIAVNKSNKELLDFILADTKLKPLPKKHILSYSQDNNSGRVVYLRHKLYSLQITQKITDIPNFAGTVAHEATHVTEHVLNDSGIQFNEHTSEAYAYMIDFITKSIFEQSLKP